MCCYEIVMKSTTLSQIFYDTSPFKCKNGSHVVYTLNVEIYLSVNLCGLDYMESECAGELSVGFQTEARPLNSPHKPINFRDQYFRYGENCYQVLRYMCILQTLPVTNQTSINWPNIGWTGQMFIYITSFPIWNRMCHSDLWCRRFSQILC